MVKTKKSMSLILAIMMLLAMACGAWAAPLGQQKADGVLLVVTDDIETTNQRGAQAVNGGSLDITGNITTTNTTGAAVLALFVQGPLPSFASCIGNITTYGTWTHALYAAYGGTIIYSGDISTWDDYSHGAHARYEDANITITGGNIVTRGATAYGLYAEDGGVVTKKGGTITTADGGISWSMVARDNSIINLNGVTIESDNLLMTQDSGIVNIIDSTLTGDILQRGDDEGLLNITLTNSTWDGAAEASGDIGMIDITLVGSDWNVTGDTNTNGTVKTDSDSNIDFRGTTDNITVVIDDLAGAPGLNIKVGDELIIKNQTGNLPESSDPSVIEIVENPNGSVSIISKGDGEAELTYQYVDENGKIQTVTIGVVSGSGVKPSGGSGGSSGCNAGFGVLALLGLAFVYKKK